MYECSYCNECAVCGSQFGAKIKDLEKELYNVEIYLADLRKVFKQIDMLAGRPTRDGRKKIQELCFGVLCTTDEKP